MTQTWPKSAEGEPGAEVPGNRRLDRPSLLSHTGQRRIELSKATPRGVNKIFLKGLILAQNERWRRGLGMQVERIPGGLLSGESGERGSKAWVTYPGDWDSPPNGGVIPGDLAEGHPPARR